MKISIKKLKLTTNSLKKTPPKSTNLKYLTPKTRRHTLQKKAVKLQKLSEKLEKYENYMCRLENERSTEMDAIIKKIRGDFSHDLQQIFEEHDKGDILKTI